MSWLKLDDRFDEHPKLYDCADYDAAFVAHIRLGLYCARNTTDGFVPQRVAIEKAGKALPELIRVNLAEQAEGGIIVHDYLDYNPSREKVMSEREAAKDRQSKRRTKQSHGSSHAVSHAVTDGVTPSVSHGVCSAAPYPYPIPLPEPQEQVFESKDDSKTSPCRSVPVDNSVNVPDDVVGYFTDKVGHDPTKDDLRSLRTLVRKFGGGVTKTAIGQAVVQGESPNNFALITTIAKAEAS